MSYWVKSSEDSMIPSWLQEGLNNVCSCGTEMLNFHNDAGDCTNRRCPNPACPLTLAKKIADMCTLLKIAGIKEGKGLRLVEDYKLKSHFEALPHIVEGKPKVTLGTLFRVTFIPGVDTSWEKECAPYSSVQEMLDKYRGDRRQELVAYKEELLKGEEYFDVVKPKAFQYQAVVTGEVMISGAIKGYDPRERFVYEYNAVTGGLIQMTYTKSKNSRVKYLIQEKDAAHKTKYNYAIEHGIEVVTPEEYKAKLYAELVQEIKRKGVKIDELKTVH